MKQWRRVAALPSDSFGLFHVSAVRLAKKQKATPGDVASSVQQQCPTDRVEVGRRRAASHSAPAKRTALCKKPPPRVSKVSGNTPAASSRAPCITTRSIPAVGPTPLCSTVSPDGGGSLFFVSPIIPRRHALPNRNNPPTSLLVSASPRISTSDYCGPSRPNPSTTSPLSKGGPIDSAPSAVATSTSSDPSPPTPQQPMVIPLLSSVVDVFGVPLSARVSALILSSTSPSTLSLVARTATNPPLLITAWLTYARGLLDCIIRLSNGGAPNFRQNALHAAEGGGPERMITVFTLTRKAHASAEGGAPPQQARRVNTVGMLAAASPNSNGRARPLLASRSFGSRQLLAQLLPPSPSSSNRDGGAPMSAHRSPQVSQRHGIVSLLDVVGSAALAFPDRSPQQMCAVLDDLLRPFHTIRRHCLPMHADGASHACPLPTVVPLSAPLLPKISDSASAAVLPRLLNGAFASYRFGGLAINVIAHLQRFERELGSSSSPPKVASPPPLRYPHYLSQYPLWVVERAGVSDSVSDASTAPPAIDFIRSSFDALSGSATSTMLIPLKRLAVSIAEEPCDDDDEEPLLLGAAPSSPSFEEQLAAIPDLYLELRWDWQPKKDASSRPRRFFGVLSVPKTLSGNADVAASVVRQLRVADDAPEEMICAADEMGNSAAEALHAPFTFAATRSSDMAAVPRWGSHSASELELPPTIGLVVPSLPPSQQTLRVHVSERCTPAAALSPEFLAAIDGESLYCTSSPIFGPVPAADGCGVRSRAPICGPPPIGACLVPQGLQLSPAHVMRSVGSLSPAVSMRGASDDDGVCLDYCGHLVDANAVFGVSLPRDYCLRRLLHNSAAMSVPFVAHLIASFKRREGQSHASVLSSSPQGIGRCLPDCPTAAAVPQAELRKFASFYQFRFRARSWATDQFPTSVDGEGAGPSSSLFRRLRCVVGSGATALSSDLPMERANVAEACYIEMWTSSMPNFAVAQSQQQADTGDDGLPEDFFVDVEDMEAPSFQPMRHINHTNSAPLLRMPSALISLSDLPSRSYASIVAAHLLYMPFLAPIGRIQQASTVPLSVALARRQDTVSWYRDQLTYYRRQQERQQQGSSAPPSAPMRRPRLPFLSLSAESDTDSTASGFATVLGIQCAFSGRMFVESLLCFGVPNPTVNSELFWALAAAAHGRHCVDAALNGAAIGGTRLPIEPYFSSSEWSPYWVRLSDLTHDAGGECLVARSHHEPPGTSSSSFSGRGSAPLPSHPLGQVEDGLAASMALSSMIRRYWADMAEENCQRGHHVDFFDGSIRAAASRVGSASWELTLNSQVADAEFATEQLGKSHGGAVSASVTGRSPICDILPSTTVTVARDRILAHVVCHDLLRMVAEVKAAHGIDDGAGDVFRRLDATRSAGNRKWVLTGTYVIYRSREVLVQLRAPAGYQPRRTPV